MTDDEAAAGSATDGDDAPASRATSTEVIDPLTRRSEQALGRYGRRMRRQRARYFGIVAIVVVAVLVWAVVTWDRGEASHVTLKTAAHPAPSLALRAPSANLTQAWHSNDRTAIGTPYSGGTVITYSTHSVRGRNATTGAITWSYTRSDRTVCQAIQDAGVTVAVYRIDGDCQEVTAFDSVTGHRDWTRTLFENAKPIRGTPTYQLTSNTLMITTPAVIYAIAPGDGSFEQGGDRWIFAQPGCRINSAVYGTAGALISQTCTHRNCQSLTYCANGRQLVLRDPFTGQSDDDKYKANPDFLKWIRAGSADVPVSADGTISAYNPATGTLDVFGAAKGAIADQFPVGQNLPTATLGHQVTDQGELVWIDGHCLLVDAAGRAVTWSTMTSAPPTVTPERPLRDEDNPPLDTSLIAVPSAKGISLLDPHNGTVARDFAVPAPATGSQVWPLGSGFVVAGATTTVYR